ncbi:flagellar brake protein [Vibrio sp. TH_r3]|uniref:flagellar brake protein n=1 Tax=Vibrio sp. TH_r3 TaxID=3082084 RepID=UPI002955B2F4|nr:flagellar brake protein [Vibrio sp. TH_r3]MDV7104813.1 flagellar brake protein [Vibrio sp. TH_r3]
MGSQYLGTQQDKMDIKEPPAIKGNESTINSTDAIDMVSHGSELTVNLTTPVGIKYMGKTNFVGTHSNNLILMEVPNISEEDQNYFFQEGFWMNVRAISQKGEGALIYFRAQIMHILKEPIPLVMISIPSMMKIHQLRKEPRYDVSLKACVEIANSDNFTNTSDAATSTKAGQNKIECEVRDLSKGGCRFITSPLAKKFDVGEEVVINIMTSANSKVKLLPLHGKICNLQSSMHFAKYGLRFDSTGKAHVKSLLSLLKFDGVKLTLKL